MVAMGVGAMQRCRCVGTNSRDNSTAFEIEMSLVRKGKDPTTEGLQFSARWLRCNPCKALLKVNQHSYQKSTSLQTLNPDPKT